MIDFAGDLDRIFADPQGFAENAVYQRNGEPDRTVRVVPARPDEVVSFGEMRISSETAWFLVPVSEIASPLAGDRLTFDATAYVIQGQPRRDEQRLVWTVETRPA